MTIDRNDIADPDVLAAWQSSLIAVTYYRRTADSRGEPHDPQWDEWEAEAFLTLNLPPGTYVDDDYNIVARSNDGHLTIRHATHVQADHAGKGKGKGGGGTTGSGTKDDPVKTGSATEAAAALGAGKYVELESDREVSTLLDELSANVTDARAKGVDAPDYDLCKVTVPGTNLFCSQSKGVPRVRMPQLSGKPVPGSKADKMPKNAKGEVDLGPEFVKYMESRGIKTTRAEVPAEVLKASQNQLNGAKVAGMTAAKKAGTMPDGDIFVTRDDYVIDGHHRWAMNVADGLSGGDSTMGVKVIDADIIPVLAAANNFTTSMGIPHAGVSAPVPKDLDPTRFVMPIP